MNNEDEGNAHLQWASASFEKVNVRGYAPFPSRYVIFSSYLNKESLGLHFRATVILYVCLPSKLHTFEGILYKGTGDAPLARVARAGARGEAWDDSIRRTSTARRATTWMHRS